MTRREPPDVAVLAARLQRAYPSLSPYSAATLANELCAIERAQRRHAERCCSGEDGGYVRKRDFAKVAVFDGKEPRGTTEWRRDPNTGRWLVEHDPDAERRAGERIERRLARWITRLGNLRNDPEGTWTSDTQKPAVNLQDDPRGPVLVLLLPGEAEGVTV